MHKSGKVMASRDLVLIGGGHAHALVLKRWGMNPLPGARLTLINPGPTAPYTGMLPGFVAGHYGRDELDIDLVQLCRFAGARLILDRADGLDLDAKTVRLAGRPSISFDVLSIDIGIHGVLPGIPGLADHGVAAKPLGLFADRWSAFTAEVEAGEAATMVLIGGGVASVELALAMHHRLQNLGARPEVTIIERSGRILDGLGNGARTALLGRLAAADINLVTNAEVAAVIPAGVVLADETILPARLTVAAAGAVPYDWLNGTGLPLHEGSIRIGETLEVAGQPTVFAAGDCAHMGFAPRDKAGVYAVRQAPVLAANLRAAVRGLPPAKTYAPQKRYLKLISTGTKTAAVDRGGLAWHGRLAWHLKDRIDRRFMDGLSDLPVMASDIPREAAAGAVAALELCGGCGGKAGRRALGDGLGGVSQTGRSDVVRGIGDDAGVLRHGGGFQVVTTDSLSGVTPDPYLLARIAAVHALGDVWAMGAAPQACVVSITLPRMNAALQSRTLAEISAGVEHVMAEAGTVIIGGHTALGAELTVGLTVTGLADHLMAERGAKAGDALILTKPLGTGTVLAAAMAHRKSAMARGDDVAAAWASMARPQGRAAAIIGPRATALTDVTGFGLANHVEDLCGDGVTPRLDVGALPLLNGAAALAEAGVRSSLFADNVAATGRSAPGDAREALLYDPQTAGGLVAAIPPAALDEVARMMADAGEPFWVIGRIEEAGSVSPRVAG